MAWITRRKFLSREDGAATIEAVLWMPVFIFIVALVFDASMLFYNQSRVFRIVQDANRQVSVGLRSREQAEEFIRNEMARFSENAVPRVERDFPFVRSQVTVRAGDLGGVGLLRLMANLQVTIQAQHMLEGE